LTVTAPSDPNLAPPGYYMLFLLDGNGVPSVASIVHLAAGAAAPGITVAPISGLVTTEGFPG